MPCRVCEYMLVEAQRRQLVFARRGLLRSQWQWEVEIGRL